MRTRTAFSDNRSSLQWTLGGRTGWLPLLAAFSLLMPGLPTIWANGQDLSPHAVEGGILFSYRAAPGASSVNLAGEFNGWSVSATPMKDEDEDGVWAVVFPLVRGRYEYKFVVNGSQWVTDPNAHGVNPSNYNNGIVYVEMEPPASPFVGQSDTTWVTDQDLSPHPVEGGMLFSHRADPGTHSVYLAGEFNNWNVTSHSFHDDDGDGLWRVVYSLDAGKAYQYKFVVNGSQWVTDPHAHGTDPDNYNNGIVHASKLGIPYAARVSPADGSRSTTLPTVSGEIQCYGDAVDPSSIRVFLGSTLLEHTYDAATGRFSANLSENLADGEYAITIAAMTSGTGKVGKSVFHFVLDRVPAEFESPDFYDDSVVYEIFVRRFRDSDGDGIGDLNGVREMLDYLNDGDPATTGDLGVTSIWFMPTNESPSQHGYDITDYYKVEPDYGTNEDFFSLCEEAHQRGMRIILDYVVNHCSDRHPFFRDAYGNPSSKYSSWFTFTDEGNFEHKSWSGYGGMPEFNFDSREARDYLLEVARYWMDPNGDGDFTDGVDGLRCDVAKGPPHDWWKELRSYTKAIRPDFLILGEVWDGSPEVLLGYFDEEFDMQFDYPLYYKLLDLLNAANVARFVEILERGTQVFPAQAQLCRFLCNHDNDRILSAVGGSHGLNRLGVLTLMTLPGTPMIYYGEEIGMKGVNPPDDAIRRQMEWQTVETQQQSKESLWHWYRSAISWRNEHPSLRARHDPEVESFQTVETGHSGVLAYLRHTEGSDPFLVVVNLSGQGITSVSLSLSSSPLESGNYRVLDLIQESAPGSPLEVVKGGGFQEYTPVDYLPPRQALLLKLARQ